MISRQPDAIGVGASRPAPRAPRQVAAVAVVPGEQIGGFGLGVRAEAGLPACCVDRDPCDRHPSGCSAIQRMSDRRSRCAAPAASRNRQPLADLIDVCLGPALRARRASPAPTSSRPGRRSSARAWRRSPGRSRSSGAAPRRRPGARPEPATLVVRGRERLRARAAASRAARHRARQRLLRLALRRAARPEAGPGRRGRAARRSRAADPPARAPDAALAARARLAARRSRRPACGDARSTRLGAGGPARRRTGRARRRDDSAAFLPRADATSNRRSNSIFGAGTDDHAPAPALQLSRQPPPLAAVARRRACRPAPRTRPPRSSPSRARSATWRSARPTPRSRSSNMPR